MRGAGEITLVRKEDEGRRTEKQPHNRQNLIMIHVNANSACDDFMRRWAGHSVLSYSASTVAICQYICLRFDRLSRAGSITGRTGGAA